MEIKTKFNIGDRVWVIRNCKAIEIEIAAFITDGNKTWIRSAEHDVFDENTCFASKVELQNYIFG